MPSLSDIPEGLKIFLWGMLGSALVELLKVFVAYERGKMPVRYKSLGFWFVRLLLALGSGGLAVAYDIKTAILAVHIGAATPSIIENLASKGPDIKSKKS